jgi:hypothetical protein
MKMSQTRLRRLVSILPNSRFISLAPNCRKTLRLAQISAFQGQQNGAI